MEPDVLVRIVLGLTTLMLVSNQIISNNIYLLISTDCIDVNKLLIIQTQEFG